MSTDTKNEPNVREFVGSLGKIAIAGIGATAVAAMAAGAQLWAMPFPRVVFMTISTEFGFAAMWGSALYMAASVIQKPSAKPSISDRFVYAFAAVAFISATWHLYSGSRAIGDLRYCLRAPTGFECTLTISESTPPEQVKKLERLLAPFKGVHWGPE